MQNSNWHAQNWADIESEYDLVIIGGGITGAGLFRMATASGLKTLLVDANDFSFGTSSRSSKLIHGGLRYIRNLQFKVTYESVKERERLLRECPNLITPLEFIFPILQNYHVTPRQMEFSLGLYDFFGKKHAHGRMEDAVLLEKAPLLTTKDYSFSYYYFDALVDDSRLVFRNIQEGIEHGGFALNYIKVYDLLLDRHQSVVGVLLKNNETIKSEKYKEVRAKVIVNATGPWSDEIRKKITNRNIIRKLRGSHILVAYERFPIHCAFSLIHPKDKRSLFVLPWEGVIVIGTTDLDYPKDLEGNHTEPYMTTDEEEYLLQAVNHFFPSLSLKTEDILSSFSGLRPIVSSDTRNPSKASRAHIVLEENGLITITGGKLTIYRRMAADVMRKIQRIGLLIVNHPKEIFDKDSICREGNNFSENQLVRWAGRFGNRTTDFINIIQKGENELIPGTFTSWAEIRWAARNEKVLHLDDLLLRRVRLGLLLPQGGIQYAKKISAIMQEEAKWTSDKWNFELQRYQEIINKFYSKGK